MNTDKTYCTSEQCPWQHGCKRSYQNAEHDMWTWCADYWRGSDTTPKCYEPV